MPITAATTATSVTRRRDLIGSDVTLPITKDSDHRTIQTEQQTVIIAIDGPSGAGKGTIARTLSQELGYRHIDTGAMYRAVAWKALQEGMPLDDEAAVAALARRADIVVERGIVMIDGQDVTRAIRTPEIDKAASAVARLPQVRDVLVARQRDLGLGGGVVMEGRDIGTVVFPGADVKIYLDASEEERARRRVNDSAHTGSQAGHAAVAEAIKARDKADTTRTASPLSMAPDATTSTPPACRSTRSFDRAGPSSAPGSDHPPASGRRQPFDQQRNALRARLGPLRVVEVVEALLLHARRIGVESLLRAGAPSSARARKSVRHRHRVDRVQRVPRPGLLRQLDERHARIGHQSGRDQLLDALLVRGGPPLFGFRGVNSCL